MGTLSISEFYMWSHIFEVNEYYFTNICLNCFYHGIDWIYTTTETYYAYDFSVWYFWFINSVYDESFNFFFNIYWYFTLNTGSYQLLLAMALDSYMFNLIFKIPYTDEWFRSMMSTKESSLILIYHPELSFYTKMLNDNYYLNYLSIFFFSLYELGGIEAYQTAIILFPQLLGLIFITCIFISFYFSYFTHSSKEGLIVDADYLVSNSSVEAEKEITSYDDMILGIVILVYIFGWYFYVHCWSLISMMPELTLVICLFPGLYFIILGIPTFLIFDFGIFYLAYLKGIGASPVITFELMYDYIAIIIFYTNISSRYKISSNVVYLC